MLRDSSRTTSKDHDGGILELTVAGKGCILPVIKVRPNSMRMGKTDLDNIKEIICPPALIPALSKRHRSSLLDLLLVAHTPLTLSTSLPSFLPSQHSYAVLPSQ